MIRIAVVDDDREEAQEFCAQLQFTSGELQEPPALSFSRSTGSSMS